MKRRNFLQALAAIGITTAIAKPDFSEAAPNPIEGAPLKIKKDDKWIDYPEKCNVLPDVPCILFKDNIEVARGRAIEAELQPLPILYNNNSFKRPSRSIIKCEFPTTKGFSEGLFSLEMYVDNTKITAIVVGEEISITNMSMDDMKVKYIITYIVSGSVTAEEI